MSNPHYPNQPGGESPGQQPVAGYPQESHSAPNPFVSSRGGAGGGGGGRSPLAPPTGPARFLYFGLVLMLFSFAAKQVVVDLSLKSTGNLLEKNRLQAKQQAEIGEIDVALDEIEEEIAELEANAPKPPEAKDPGDDLSKDMEAYEEKRQRHDEKMGKLKKSRAIADKDLEDKRKEVRKKYRPLIRDAARDETASTASALGTVQTTLLLKLIMDLLKMLGATMCVLSGLTIAIDPEQPSGLKAYAAVLGGLAFLSTVVGGLYALFG